MILSYIGLPGSGKSTYMAMLAQQAINSGNYDKVYCNFCVAGCYEIDFKNLGKYCFENCLILIDEAMNEADSRDFKSFSAEKKYFFSNHRHYKVDIIYFTQAWDDVDKKIRNLTAKLFYVRKLLWWSIAIPIKQILTVDGMTKQIITGYELQSIILGRLCFRPKYYKYFDTYERRPLPDIPERLNKKYPELPEKARKKYISRFINKLIDITEDYNACSCNSLIFPFISTMK